MSIGPVANEFVAEGGTRVKVVKYSGVKYDIESARDRAEHNAYAHTNIELFTDIELEEERVWMEQIVGKKDSYAIVDAVRCAYADDVAAKKYVEVYIDFFKTDDFGNKCDTYCEITVYKDLT